MVIYVCEIVACLPRLTKQKISHSPLQILGNWLDIAGLGIYGISVQNQEAKSTLLTHQQLCLLWSVFYHSLDHSVHWHIVPVNVFTL